MRYVKDKDTGVEYRYCDIMNSEQYKRFAEDYDIQDCESLTLGNRIIEKETYSAYITIVVTFLPAENIIIHNEFYI